MPLYRVEYSYTPEAWNALIDGAVPRDRHRAVEDLVTALGGRFPRLVFDGEPALAAAPPKFFSFGEHDVMALIHFPDAESAAAFAMAISATRAVKSFRTTPLLTMDEGIRAMERADRGRKTAARYTPPLRSPASGT